MNEPCTAEKPASYGNLIGSPVIAGVKVDVHSNGACDFLSNDHSLDDAGNYLGVKYQCVEFVRRFIWLKHGINLAASWHEGDAGQWAGRASEMGLDVIDDADVLPGDIAVFDGGAHGHVAIVAETDPLGGCTITGQNLFNDERDLAVVLSAQVAGGSAPLQGGDGGLYFLSSYLRVPSS